MHTRIITIGGKPGSGKSSAAHAVAKILEYSRFSSGDFMRSVATDRGITLEALGKLAESDPSIDADIDAAVRAAGEKDRVVIDSRMAFHWIPHAFRVFLELPVEISAARIHSDQSEARAAVGEAGSLEELTESLKRRLASEQRRYRANYGVDPTDISQYDLVIDTSTADKEMVVKRILDAYTKWCSARGIPLSD
jgi:predicted cytidylate kinase